ncbi:AMP-binding protein [Sphingomonas colocasiae]|uniref:AMP-binding protein n=1 Tax=Sphingomonas colocasiae TaxID=1848973 RepID=A0ABS7PS52_9SPHN|nr:AMP-binding protein [Sphingomonas colocasiae]MBY8824170.1 AMP-binding protein [Sphingomonas colocasiae]
MKGIAQLSPDGSVPDRLHDGPSFGELTVRAIRRYARSPAIWYRNEMISYADMGVRVSQFVQALSARGVGSDMGVCVLMSNRPETIYLRLAVQLLGARFTPLNPLGSSADHQFITGDSQAAFLIVEDRFAGEAAGIVAAGGVRCTLSVGPAGEMPDLLDLADACPAEPLACRADPAGIAGLTYTGGTTGRPKGIIHTHRTLVANVLMCLAEWDWPPAPRILLTTPLAHAAGLLTTPVFVKGGCVFLTDGFDAGAFIDLVERQRISAAFLVPTMVYALTTHPRIRDADLSSLKLVIYGAAPISPSLLAEAMEIFGPIFLQLYAQSEAPMTVTTLSRADHDPDRPGQLLSCGFPMVGVQVKLLDDAGAAVPLGEIGEICVRGPLVMDGYWGRPQETAAALRDGWLRTGDLAREDERGYLYIVDRKKDMIITGGFNVYPKEVEDVLASHPDVAQAAVFGIPDAKWGEAVKAAIVPWPGRTPDVAEIIAFVRRSKGAVGTPKSIDILDAMPQTALGKPDKQALRAPYWQDARRNVG